MEEFLTEQQKGTKEYLLKVRSLLWCCDRCALSQRLCSTCVLVGAWMKRTQLAGTLLSLHPPQSTYDKFLGSYILAASASLERSSDPPQTIAPVLTEAMAVVAVERPEQPLAWISMYILEHSEAADELQIVSKVASSSKEVGSSQSIEDNES